MDLLEIITLAAESVGVLGVVFYALQAWGLYSIAKKLGEAYPWLAFIPLLQMYTMVKTGGKSAWWILWIILGFMLFVIPGLILLVIVFHGISKRTGRGAWTTIGFLFVPFIMFPVVGYKLPENPEQKVEVTPNLSEEIV